MSSETEQDQIFETLAPPPRTLMETKSLYHAENCEALAEWLRNNPLEWEDGEYYGVTLSDQQNMVLVLNTYANSKAMGETPVLKWNSHTKRCREFTEEEFARLSKAVEAVVRPRLEYCQLIKERIFQATSENEVSNIKFDYNTLSI